jgi:hypothetical protein
VVVVGDGQGTGSGVVEVADAGIASGAGTAAGGTRAGGTAATADRGPGQLPVAWLVLVALAALVGSVVGTRLTTRGLAGAG